MNLLSSRRSSNGTALALLLLLFSLACEPSPDDRRQRGGARVLANASAPEKGGSAQEPLSKLPRGWLSRGEELEDKIAATEVHQYQILLEAGEYLHLEVEQHDVDLALKLIGPDAGENGPFDSPNGAFGAEPLWALVSGKGTYLVEIQASRGAGSYIIRHVAQRYPTAEDRIVLAAWKAYTEGRQWQRSHPREALKHFREAEKLWRQLGDSVQQAITHLRIGDVQLDLGEKATAIESFRQALEFLRDLGKTSQEVVVLQRLGGALRQNAEYSAALAAYEDGLRRVRQIGDRFEEAHAMNNVALVLDLQGRMGKALGMYREALDFYREKEAWSRLATTLTNMAFSHILAGQLTEARQALLEALEIHQETGNDRGVASVKAQLGWIAYREGDTTAGLDEYEQAIELSRTIEQDPEARRIEAASLDRKGTALRSLGELTKARAAYAQSRQIFADLKDELFVAHVEANLGWLDLDDGETERAWARFELAWERFERSGERHGQANALYLGAAIERRRGRLAEARTLLEQVLEIVESNRRFSSNPTVRISYLGSRYDYYESYIDLLMEQHYQEPERGHAMTALAAVERSRARSLLEHVTEAGADLRRGVEEELLTEETSLQDQINAKEVERIEKPSPEVERQVEELSQRYRRLQEHIRESNPVYADLTQARPLGLSAIQQQLLDEDSLLLVYSLGHRRSFLWAISAVSMTVHVLGSADKIEKLAVKLHRRLSDSDRPAARLQAELTASELSGMVLGPVASELGSRRLLVMPDGALHLVPFAALPEPASTTPLVVEHEVVYVPSASAIVALRQEIASRPTPEKFMAILADPVYQLDDPRIRKVTSATTAAAWPPPEGFKRLVHSRHEAEQILSLADEVDGSLAAFGFAARRMLVTSGDLAAFRYLHFATHGTFDVAHPERSGLVLSTFDEEGRPVDGILRAHELYRLRLSAELAVLSGCQTALGPVVRGEGILGLARGFMYAGTPRVVVSLWSVSDEGTAELMRRFYEAHFRHGIRPSEALQMAQRSMLDDPGWQAPYYWAAFVFQGDWR